MDLPALGMFDYLQFQRVLIYLHWVCLITYNFNGYGFTCIGYGFTYITWERNLLHLAEKPFWCLELSAINIHFMRFAYGQIHFCGDIAMATLSILPLYSSIATVIFESRYKYYFCSYNQIIFGSGS